MTPASDIAFLHTAPVHVATFAALVERLQPGARAAHVVDEALLRDAREFGPDAPEIVRRVRDAVRSAAGATGARVVVCTCSTLGAAAEVTPTDGAFVAQRIDRAMADAAARSGPKVLVVTALSSTLAPTAALVADSARRLERPVETTECLVDGAWGHFERGDLAAYYGAIAAAVRERAAAVDVVVLAQASMAPAAALLSDVAAPVLSSPELGVRAALRMHESPTLRAFIPDDWAALCDLYERAARYEMALSGTDPRALRPMPEEEDFETFQRLNTTRVACVDGRPVGFVAWRDRDDWQGSGYLSWLYVDPEFHRRGIGDRLMAEAMAALGDQAWTLTRGGNEPALRLYQKHGMRIVFVRPGDAWGYPMTEVRLALPTSRKADPTVPSFGA